MIKQGFKKEGDKYSIDSHHPTVQELGEKFINMTKNYHPMIVISTLKMLSEFFEDIYLQKNENEPIDG